MILVVGGAGFVGSHFVKELRRSGREHLVFDNLESGFAKAIEGSAFVMGDLRRPADLERVFGEFEISTVVHFAACIEVGESVKDPAKFYWNNVYSSLCLLEAMRQAKVGQLVFSSTAAVYGEPVTHPIPEDHPKLPLNPYGNTKLAMERMIEDFSAAYGLRAVALRYFNAAGADREGVLGEAHQPESHLIPLAIDAALRRRPQLKLFGEDYPTPDGTCVRDYIHVDDLATAHLAAVDYLAEGGTSTAMNLGTAQGASVREVIEAVGRAVGTPVPYEVAPRRPGDPAFLVASNDRAKEVLGWMPVHSALDQLAADAARWRIDHPNGYA